MSVKNSFSKIEMEVHATTITKTCFEIILVVKLKNFRWKNFDNFAQNIDCGYTLNRLTEAVLTSTHNLCFGAKIKKK